MSKRIKTSASIRTIAPAPGRRIEHLDEQVAGLALRVTSNGKKSWSLRYRTGTGEQRRLTIGPYPVVGLADARQRAMQALGLVAAGGDPAKEKRTARATAKAKRVSTVSELVEDYLADATKGRHRPNARPKRSSTLDLERDYFDRLIKPRFGDLPISELARSEVQRFVDEVGETAPGSARHCRNIIRQAYNYAIRREVAGKNPAQLVNVAAQGVRDRVLSDDELRAVWMAAVGPLSTGSSRAGLAICLAMVTLQRGGEICGIHAREINFDEKLWTIPGYRTKNHLTHAVPLSSTALDILDRAFVAAGKGGGFAFPSPSGHGSMTRPALTTAMRKLAKTLNIPDATVHDLRRSGSTNITGERIGISRFIVSRVLNQMSDTGGAATVTSVYDRNEYLAEKRRALDAWAALLSEIVGGEKRPANVLSLTRAGS